MDIVAKPNWAYLWEQFGFATAFIKQRMEAVQTDDTSVTIYGFPLLFL